jgi:hypothetical protein
MHQRGLFVKKSGKFINYLDLTIIIFNLYNDNMKIIKDI